jgi:hypothetical protein
MTKPHHSVNLRYGYAEGRFGDDESREKYAAECERFRATMATRYAVAPGQRVTTPSGRIIPAKVAIDANDLRGDSTRPAWRILEQLVRAGSVLENYEFTSPPEAA